MNRRLALAATGAALVAALSACSSDHSGHSSAASVAGGAASAAASAADPAASTVAPAASGMSSAGASARVGSAADVMFAQAMIPHHAQAVELADLALQKASSPQVKALATQIKAAQDPEIATMRGWLSSWGAPEQMSGDHAAMGHMDGMLSEGDLAKVRSQSGADFDRVWLQAMIAHHEGALTMANDVLAATKDDRVKTLAQAVVTGQTAEIEAMKKLLAG